MREQRLVRRGRERVVAQLEEQNRQASESARELARALERARGRDLRGLHRRLGVRRAPEPEDVRWENVPCTPRECTTRQALVTAMLLGIALLGTAFCTLTTSG